jgi:hypothetical protein
MKTLKGGSIKELTSTIEFKSSIESRMLLLGLNTKTTLLTDKIESKMKSIFSDSRRSLSDEMIAFANKCLT